MVKRHSPASGLMQELEKIEGGIVQKLQRLYEKLRPLEEELAKVRDWIDYGG